MEANWVIDHIGFVVHDVERTVSTLGSYLGLMNWETRTIEPPLLDDITVDGRRVSHSFKVAVAQFGGIALEFIEPLEGETVYSAFLREKGEGFHHICVSFPTIEQLECAKQALIRMGGRVTQSGRTPRASYWYVEGRGIVLELIIRRQHQGT